MQFRRMLPVDPKKRGAEREHAAVLGDEPIPVAVGVGVADDRRFCQIRRSTRRTARRRRRRCRRTL
jgi:hypothetical protein